MAVSYWNLLALSLALLLLLILATRLSQRVRAGHLRRLASAAQMRYSAVDRFHLAPRAGECLGIGAADVRVRDLMYRVGPGGYFYVFTAEYVLGTAGGLRRRQLVMRAEERSGQCQRLIGVNLGDATRPLAEQYRSLLPADRSGDGAAVRAV